MAAIRRRPRPLVAIDGPVGAGKSTVARALARVLGFTYLNTGAMYRAVAIAAVERGIDPDDVPGWRRVWRRYSRDRDWLRRRARAARRPRRQRKALSQPAISELASRLSTLAVVRDRAAPGAARGGRDGGYRDGRTRYRHRDLSRCRMQIFSRPPKSKCARAGVSTNWWRRAPISPSSGAGAIARTRSARPGARTGAAAPRRRRDRDRCDPTRR